MAKGNHRNYVSFWFWIFALFIAAVPCIGWIMIVVWAFVGSNESRKNYFRALIVWFVIIAAVSLAMTAFGVWPLIEQKVQMWLQPGK